MAAARDVVFISHANPEDCQFATWLTTQLVREGYKVWCDDKDFLCGDDFWKDIEDAIRHRTAKFVLVASPASKSKPGVLNELHLATIVERAEKLVDFILPVVIGDIPYSELNIEVARLMAASFRPSWAAGLAQLLARLKADGVPKTGPGPEGMAAMWRRTNGAMVGVSQAPETCLTNWYPISGLPQNIVLANPSAEMRAKYLDELQPYPVSSIGETVVALSSRLTPTIEEYRTVAAVGLDDAEGFARRELNKTVVELLRQGWEKTCRARGLRHFTLANRRTCFFFELGQLQDNEVSFAGVDGKNHRRAVVGYKTVRSRGIERKRWWHLAAQAKVLLKPEPLFVLKLHILFSDDGKNIWSSSERLHRARRSQGKSWWNDDWRDRGLGFMKSLAGAEENIHVPFGANQSFAVAAFPITIESPVSFSAEDIEEPLEEATGLELGDEEDVA